MRALTAVLFIDDHGTTPTAGITIERDGQPMVQQEGIAPADWLTAVDALGTAISVDLRGQLSQPISDLLDDLQAAVDAGQAAQAEREQALAAWQQATGTASA